METLPVRYGVIRDEYHFSQDGAPEPFKNCTVFIGKHGPFIERIPATPDWAQELARRVAALKVSLETLPT